MQKRQHTVPRCYLQHFTDSVGFVWVLDTSNKIYKIKPENILVESHFYTITLKSGERSFLVEDTLSNIEYEYSNIFETKISKGKQLTDQERAKVAVFIAAMIHRTQPNREGMKGMFIQLKETMEEWKEQAKTYTAEQKRTMSAIPSSGGTSISLKDIDDGLQNFDEEHSMSMLNQLSSTAQIIFDMKWSFMSPDNAQSFVTCDDPVVTLRPESIKKYGPNAFGSRPGLAYEDVELTLPLSKKLTLLAGWRLTHNSYLPIPDVMVSGINQRTILNSSHKVIASSKKGLEDVMSKYPPLPKK